MLFPRGEYTYVLAIDTSGVSIIFFGKKVEFKAGEYELVAIMVRRPPKLCLQFQFFNQ